MYEPQNNIWKYKVQSSTIYLSLISYLLIVPIDYFTSVTSRNMYIATNSLGVVGSLVALIFFYKLKSPRAAVMITIATAALTLCIIITQTGGIMSQATIWLVMFPVGLGFLEGRKAALGGCALSLSITALFIVAHFLHIGAPVNVPVNDLVFRVRGIIGTNFLMTAIIFLSQKKLDSKYDALLESNEKVQELLQIIGHDIRNPIMLITSSIKQILKNIDTCTGALKKLYQVKKSPIGTICETANAILSIIEQVRELQAIDRGKIEIEIQEVNIKDVIDDIKNNFQKELTTKNISLIFTTEQTDLPIVFADKKILSQAILSSIISNAIKFSYPKSTIEISLQKNKAKQTVIKIKDQGIGIPTELLTNLFAATKKNGRVGTAGEKGAGFSIPIAKKYIDLCHGEITIETRNINEYPHNHGTTVTLILNSKKSSNQQNKKNLVEFKKAA